MNPSKIFDQLIAKNDLNAVDMSAIMNACMSGELSDTQIAVFLALMRMKGETLEELTIAANILKECARPINLGSGLIDIVGTGGDGKHTFNISTLSSIIAAAAGARVAKHGSNSVSSRSGSSDLLLEAGLKLDLTNEQLKQCLLETNICFLYAPHFHQAMHHVRAARQQLGIRSFFNLLGPLINPANVTKHVVGVFDQRWQRPIAQVLAQMGSEHALVVSSQDGMDEVSIAATTDVIEYHQGEFTTWSINPKHYGCYHSTIHGLVVDSPRESLRLIRSVLSGDKNPARDIALLNTAIALYCAELCSSYEQGIELAAATIDSGKANACFEQLLTFSQSNEVS